MDKKTKELINEIVTDLAPYGSSIDSSMFNENCWECDGLLFDCFDEDCDCNQNAVGFEDDEDENDFYLTIRQVFYLYRNKNTKSIPKLFYSYLTVIDACYLPEDEKGYEVLSEAFNSLFEIMDMQINLERVNTVDSLAEVLNSINTELNATAEFISNYLSSLIEEETKKQVSELVEIRGKLEST